MNFSIFGGFILFAILTSAKEINNNSQIGLFPSKQQISSITIADINDNISMFEQSYNLKQGEIKEINFYKPYGLILMRNWENILLDVNKCVNPINGAIGKIGPLQEGEPRIGIYFGQYIGSVQICALQDTFVSFSNIVFPEDCTYRYISNTVTEKFSLKSTNFLNHSTFCYFNTAQLPITYTINYSIGNDYLRILTNSALDFNGTDAGYVNQKLEVPAFIKITTSKDIKKKHFVNMMMSSSNTEKPAYKFNGFLNSQDPSYIIGEEKRKKVSSSAVAAIVVACVVFFALVVYAFTYLCLSHRRKHRHHHHQDSNNNNNNNNNINSRNVNANNNNNNNANNANNNNNENPDEEKDIIENGRYKTPAHVNIEMISSQFDQKYKSSNPSFFPRKSSSHFENDKDMDEDDFENNGYPLNEYHAPSKGILAPTSISQFSENDDVDDEYDEDNDLENVKEAPFKSISHSNNDSDSDDEEDNDD